MTITPRTVRQQITLLPTVAAAGTILALAVILISGVLTIRTQRKIEAGHAPMLEARRDLELGLTAYQRRLQDAVAATNASGLEKADSIAQAFLARVQQARSLSVADLAELDSVAQAFTAYTVIGRRTSATMIAGSGGDSLTSWIGQMTSSFKALQTRLIDGTAAEQRLTSEAFATARKRQVTSTVLTAVVLIGAVIGLIWLSRRVIQRITTRLDSTVRVLEAVAAGDLTQRLELDGDDELARMARSLNHAIGAQQRTFAEAEEAQSRVREAGERERREMEERQVLEARLAAEKETARQEEDKKERLRVAEREAAQALQMESERARAEEERSRAELERREAADLRAKIDAILAVADAAAEGDLTREITVQGDDAVGRLGTGLATFFRSLRGSIANIALTAETVSAASSQVTGATRRLDAAAGGTSAQATVVATAADEVSRNIQTVAVGTEEMSSSIREIARSSAEAAQVAAQAVKVAERTNATVGKLGDSSTEIGKVIKVITSIAQQTNLLALNATIEAARAGEAGKGFAVVANEVKELAKETARATEEIGRKIEAIQTDTVDAVTAIREISEIIAQINAIQITIAGAVEEQTATTGEMSRNITEASRGAQEIAHNIQGVARTAQGTTEDAGQSQSAANELARAAEQLQELVERFKIGNEPTSKAAHPSRAPLPTKRSTAVRAGA